MACCDVERAHQGELFSGPTRCSVHVKVALEDTLLEGVGLLRNPGPGSLGWRGGHVRDRLGALVDGGLRRGGDVAGARRGAVETRGKGEGRARAGDGALGAGPKLIGPVEALV